MEGAIIKSKAIKKLSLKRRVEGITSLEVSELKKRLALFRVFAKVDINGIALSKRAKLSKVSRFCAFYRLMVVVMPAYIPESPLRRHKRIRSFPVEQPHFFSDFERMSSWKDFLMGLQSPKQFNFVTANRQRVSGD